MDEASDRRIIEDLLVAAGASEAIDRAHKTATEEAVKHREQERFHREAAEIAELLAQRLERIRQPTSADGSDSVSPNGNRAGAPAPSGGVQERANQAALVRGALGTRTAGENVSPKKIFAQLTAQGATVVLSNVQLEMGRLAKKEKLIRLDRGEYQIPSGGFLGSDSE